MHFISFIFIRLYLNQHSSENTWFRLFLKARTRLFGDERIVVTSMKIECSVTRRDLDIISMYRN